MKAKKTIALIAIIAAIAAASFGRTAYARQFTSQWASGHHPAQSQSPSTEYSCYLGGNSSAVTSSMSYGNDTAALYLHLTPLAYYIDSDGISGILNEGASVTGHGALSLTLPESNLGYPYFDIVSADSYYKINSTQVAFLSIS